MLPSSFGIMRIVKGKRIVERKASFNTTIDPDAQLNMLSKKELGTIFSGICDRREIRNRFTDQIINNQLKKH